jgi:hypothetical protein
VRLPCFAGVNVTLMEHLAPEARLDPQALVSAKSPGSVPVIEILLMLTVEPPLLVTASFLSALSVRVRDCRRTQGVES